MLLLKTPGEEAVGISRVAIEKATMIMGQASELPLADELSGILDERGPAIVVTYRSHHSRFAYGGSTLNGFLGILADWFLTQDVFPSLGRCPVDLQVQPVGRSYADRLHLGIGDHRTPVSGVALEAKALLGGLRTRFYSVGADKESRDNAALMKPVRNGTIRAAMHFAHPAHANHADTDGTCHGDTSNLV